MAASLTNAALSEVRPAHASYYGEINEKNPVILAVGKELDEFRTYIEKSNSPNYKREANEAMSRGSNWLFDIWNKYALRLPTQFYYDKLIQTGDYLLKQETYDIAIYQCYNRFLTTCHGQPLTSKALSAKECKMLYFTNGFKEKSVIPTCQALLGALSCQFHMVRVTDQDFVRTDSILRCVSILRNLQGFMQCIQGYEPLYWVMYNCTIKVYEMCRKLMTSGKSIKVVEYLVWACMCMEASIPLLSVKFLTWRVTLYTAVCLAYYDCKAGALAEKFARRALTKLQELSELESMSGTGENDTTRLIFQQATVKMAAMVFKRTVFESRRRPKGLLRPKMRNNLKEAASLVWPRTQTEKLLGDMFIGSAAQFLAIIEALSDSHRRSLQPQPPAAENDVEMLDVYAELIFAGKEIIAGGGGSSIQNASESDHSALGGMRNDKSLIQLAASGEDGVTLVSVVRFIKLAFCYEQWDTFSTLLESALLYIRKYNEAGETEFKDLELCLAVMLLTERVTRAKSVRRIIPTTIASAVNVLDEKLDSQTTTESSVLTILPHDDLINLAEAIYFSASNPELFSPIGKDREVILDRDMVLDISILLWKKTKSVLLRMRNNGQIENISPKWMHLLQIINSCFVWCGIASVEPTILADVALHLSSLLELSTTYAEIPSDGLEKSKYSAASDASHSQYHTKNDRLSSACEVLSNAINSLCAGITQTMSFTNYVAERSSSAAQESGSNLSPRDALIQDFLVELLNAHHRIYLKLAKRSNKQADKEGKSARSSRNSLVPSQLQIQVPDYGKNKLLSHVRGNLVSNALLYTQRAVIEYGRDLSKAEESMVKAMELLKRAETEEVKLRCLETKGNVRNLAANNLPPPPILLARSNTTMLFKPAPFQGDESVAWYRLLGRTSAGHNVKVRLNDYFLVGTGKEVPAGEDCIFRIDGLKPNERYVFAVAAYTSNGTLIGNSIGVTSDVIPAHYPMSVLNAWCILAECAIRVDLSHIAKQASQVLWNHFVEPLTDPNLGQYTSSKQDFELSLYKLNKAIVGKSSEVLIRHAITSVLISVEATILEKGLFSTNLCESGPPLSSQIARLRECEKLLAGMDLCSHLGDLNYLLQSATKCFGLMIPIMQADIYTKPIVQILVRCHTVLCEACTGSLNQFSPSIGKSVHHMIASITFYLAKVFRAWGRPEACYNVIETGKQLLIQNDSLLPTQKPAESGGVSNVTITQARKRTVKVAPKPPFNVSHELSALEERLAELTKEKNSAGELTGGEDASTVLSYIVAAKPLLAYKEISKFRRRSRYLEYFVHVMHKALISGIVESAIGWSQEVLQWLRRRNEGLSVNHTILSAENGAVVMQGNDANKYAAVIVNYSKDWKQKGRKKKMITRKSKLIVKGKGDDQEDLEKRALTVLEKYFGDLYKSYVKRRKLRKLTNDEMPWRSRFNHLAGLLYFDVLQQKLEKRLRIFRGDVLPSKNINLLDHGQWSLSHCGSIVVQPSSVSYSPVSARAVTALDEYENIPGQALLYAARKAINAPFDPDSTEPALRASPILEGRVPSPQTQRTNSPVSFTSTHTVDPTVVSIQNNAIIDTFRVMMLSFRRSLVTAHRGKLWTLLQNVSRSLISCLNYIFENTVNVQEPVMTSDVFHDISRMPLALASDFLLDMLLVMRCHEESNEGWSVRSYVGNIHDEKGGRNLHFDEMIDDCHKFDFALVKILIFRSIEVLHFQGRWEQLVDICLRFSALTHDRFAESVLPVMIHAQHEIRRRVEEHHGENVTLVAWDESGKTVTLNNENYISSSLQTQPIDKDATFQINIGGYIDPAAHDVYGGGKRALALSCVPYLVDTSLDHLHSTLEKSLYFSRALIHSRRLLGLYLASQYNKRAVESAVGSAHNDRASTVSFVDVDSKNQLSFPSNMTHTNFEALDHVENSPFSHLPTVINSYTKTIELLISHGETDLVSQAYHELGNLYLHSGNTKAAMRSWSEGLDRLFGQKRTVSTWKNVFEGDEDLPKRLLKRLGFWGCLLSVTLTCKIGEFSSVDIERKTNCAILAAELVQALFRSSLPHPTSTVDYVSYEVFPVQVLYNNKRVKKCMPGATSIFPDVDLFADSYRCEPKQLMSSLHWLCENLVQLQFNMKALPCLCLYQYVATFICKDVQRSIQCRCIKLTALSNIRAFDSAINDLFHLLYGNRLPHQTEHTYREPDSQVPSFQFNLSQSIESLENLKALEVIASKRISPQLSQLYGPQLTCEITIQRTRLLIELADCISCVPERPSQKDLILISSEQVTDQSFALPGSIPGRRMTQYLTDDTRSSVSAMSSTSTAMKQFKKLFSKRDTPMTIALLKGILLGIGEAFLNAMLGPILSTTTKLLPSELWIAIQCRLQLCAIEKQRQHSTFAASHALRGLQLLQNSGRFEIVAKRHIRKIRSAFKNKRPNTGESLSQAAYMEKANDNLEQKYRARLNARMWLSTRLNLCEALQGQITGLGKIWTAMAEKTGKDGMNFLQLYCAEGLAEAEVCNDREMQASFLLSSSMSDSLTSEDAAKIMEDAISTLDELPELSDVATMALAYGTATAADLQLQSNKWTSSHAVQEFHNAHAIILLHLMQHGETIKHFENASSTLDLPLRNTYHRDLHILAHAKLRIGHANYFTLTETSGVEEWQATAEILQQAKSVCDCCSVKDVRLQAEINFELGKVTRAVYFANGCDSSSVKRNLQEAVKASPYTFPVLSRNSQLELAMLGITLLNSDSKVTPKSSDLGTIDRIAMALHASHCIAKCDQNRSMLQGSTEIVNGQFSDQCKKKLPDFILLDLATDHRKPPAEVTVDDITIDPHVAGVLMECGEFTWIHVLYYRILVLRKFSSLRVGEIDRPQTSGSEESDMLDFYPGNIRQTDQRSQAVKTPIFSTHLTVRLLALHDYLKEHLSSYQDTCRFPVYDAKSNILLVQWYRVRQRKTLLWCATGPKTCGRLLVSPSDIARLLSQIKTLLQKVEIHFGQTMATQPKQRSRNIRQRKQTGTSNIPVQLEDDVKQTLTNCALLFSPDHDIITTVPFQITVNAIESLVELFTIGCCYTDKDPLFKWLSELLVNDQ